MTFRSDIEVFDRLWTALREGEGAWLVYVYRIDSQGHMKRPYLTKCAAGPGLLNMLRDEHGGGKFHVFIRHDRVMKFSERIAVVERFAHLRHGV